MLEHKGVKYNITQEPNPKEAKELGFSRIDYKKAL